MPVYCAVSLALILFLLGAPFELNSLYAERVIVCG